MSKLKTHQALAKRFKITKTGKVIKKYCGQDHFNARESGKVTRNKRRLTNISRANQSQIKKSLPYS